MPDEPQKEFPHNTSTQSNSPFKLNANVIRTIIFIVIASVLSYIAGYDRGREDMAAAQDRAKVLRLAMESLNLTRDNERWLTWSESIDKRNYLIEKADALLNVWDGENQDVLKQIIVMTEDAKKVLEDTAGPPGAEWYRDGLIAIDQKQLKAKNLILQSLQETDTYKANQLLRDAIKLEDESSKEFIELTNRYENWLKEKGLN